MCPVWKWSTHPKTMAPRSSRERNGLCAGRQQTGQVSARITLRVAIGAGSKCVQDGATLATTDRPVNTPIATRVTLPQ